MSDLERAMESLALAKEQLDKFMLIDMEVHINLAATLELRMDAFTRDERQVACRALSAASFFQSARELGYDLCLCEIPTKGAPDGQ